MGSLYDNSGEDIYARRDIEKRRKHAMAMKKKRKRQIKYFSLWNGKK